MKKLSKGKQVLEFKLRMSEEEMLRLEAVSAHIGISKSEVIRMLLKERADRMERDQFFNRLRSVPAK